MFIVIALLAGMAAGAIVHATVANRQKRGVILSGAIGTVSATVIYAAMTWAGIAENNIWLWVASVGGSAIITWIATVALSNARVAHDERARISAGLR